MQATSIDPGPGQRRVFYTPELLATTDGKNERRACAVCGKVRRSKAPTCRACYQAIRSEISTAEFECQQCGKLTTMTRAEVGRPGRTRKFCSPECFAASIRRGGKPCKVCGKPTGSNDRRRFYCSSECKATTRPAKRTKGCPQCGVVFEFSSTRRVYCTKVCADAAHALRMVGRGNSRYLDGTSYADWFRKMRPLIKERDRNVCRACRAARSRMVVHHLNEKPWQNWPDNLIYLCGSCHAVHHKSAVSPFPWFTQYAREASEQMPAEWQATGKALADRYASAGRMAEREALRERVGSGGAAVRAEASPMEHAE